MKRFSLNLTSIFALFIGSYIAYYILLRDNFLHISISSIIANSHNLDHNQHMLVMGFLPVYISAMIFGAALLGIYIGSRLDHLVHRFVTKDHSSSSHRSS